MCLTNTLVYVCVVVWRCWGRWFWLPVEAVPPQFCAGADGWDVLTPQRPKPCLALYTSTTAGAGLSAHCIICAADCCRQQCFQEQLHHAQLISHRQPLYKLFDAAAANTMLHAVHCCQPQPAAAEQLLSRRRICDLHHGKSRTRLCRRLVDACVRCWRCWADAVVALPLWQALTACCRLDISVSQSDSCSCLAHTFKGRWITGWFCACGQALLLALLRSVPVKKQKPDQRTTRPGKEPAGVFSVNLCA